MDRQRHRACLLGAAIASLAVSVGAHPSRAEQATIDLDGLTAKQAAADLCAGKITSKAVPDGNVVSRSSGTLATRVRQAPR
jgi:mandelamide amidase